MRMFLVLILVAIFAIGCSDETPPTSDTQPVVEAGIDANNDDLAVDLGSDAGGDVAVDAGSDVIEDMGSDTTEDAVKE